MKARRPVPCGLSTNVARIELQAHSSDAPQEKIESFNARGEKIRKRSAPKKNSSKRKRQQSTDSQTRRPVNRIRSAASNDQRSVAGGKLRFAHPCSRIKHHLQPLSDKFAIAAPGSHGIASAPAQSDQIRCIPPQGIPMWGPGRTARADRSFPK
jgi:hypothetical protein